MSHSRMSKVQKSNFVCMIALKMHGKAKRTYCSMRLFAISFEKSNELSMYSKVHYSTFVRSDFYIYIVWCLTRINEKSDGA